MLSNGAVSGVPREPRRYSPERLLRGQQMPSPWPLVNAIHYVSCPRCGAPPTFRCANASGVCPTAHRERVTAYQSQSDQVGTPRWRTRRRLTHGV